MTLGRIKIKGDDELDKLLRTMGVDGEIVPTSLASHTIITSNSKQNKSLLTSSDLPHSFSIWNPNINSRISINQTVTSENTPQLECIRQTSFSNLRSKFYGLLKELGANKKANEVFESWMYRMKMERKDDLKEQDSLLFEVDSVMDEELADYIKGFNIDVPSINKFSKKLEDITNEHAKNFRKRVKSAPTSFRQAKATKMENGFWMIRYGKRSVKISAAHFEKMNCMYELNTNKKSKSNEFINALFGCILRYETFQGGGFQAAVHGEVFDVLLKYFGTDFECFASPFNARYPSYCSAFPDTDHVFGGKSDFFHFKPLEGSFEANPPFVPPLVESMAFHINGLLAASEDKEKGLMFVVIIQNFGEKARCLEGLRESCYLTSKLELTQKDHGFCEGKQQIRPTRFRISSSDTIVFFLQTAPAKTRWPVTEKSLEDLKSAFASKQREEMKEKDVFSKRKTKSAETEKNAKRKK